MPSNARTTEPIADRSVHRSIPNESCRDPAEPAHRSVTLTSGERVPYPEPTSKEATKIGRANRRAETEPERRLRSRLHRCGLRFRKDYFVRTGAVRVHIDVAFPRRQVAVFVDGCFWHGCPEHGSTPSRNRDYWVPKLRANLERDHRVDGALSDAGWLVIRVWEHEDPVVAADRVAEVLSQH